MDSFHGVECHAVQVISYDIILIVEGGVINRSGWKIVKNLNQKGVMIDWGGRKMLRIKMKELGQFLGFQKYF